MIVSRETSLNDLLSYIADKLQFHGLVIDSKLSYSGLTQSALSLVLLSLLKTIKKPVPLVFDGNLSAEKIYSECLNLVTAHLAYFPETVQTDMDVVGFNLENERYRSEAVNLIRKDIPSLIFASSLASKELAIDDIKTIEKEYFLRPGSNFDRTEIINTIARWGYENVDHTETPKTYSVRGGILDVFLPYSANPVRVEFFGNDVESLRIFNPRSQRTIKNIESLEILPPPKVGDNKENKISLIELTHGVSINVVKNEEFFTINLKGGGKTIDIDCNETINAIDDTVNNNFSVTKLIDQIDNNNIYLFSDRIKSTKTITKYKLENCNIVNSSLSSCFYSTYFNILCLSTNSLNKQKPIHKSRWTVETVSEIPQKEFSSLDDIDWGDYLVHQDFGIGLYRGLEIIKTRDNIEQECIKIEYADGASVYVPVEKFNRVHKMIVTGGNDPVLSTLNGPKWKRQKKLAKDSAKAVVQDLIQLYKSRNKKEDLPIIKIMALCRN